MIGRMNLAASKMKENVAEIVVISLELTKHGLSIAKGAESGSDREEKEAG